MMDSNNFRTILPHIESKVSIQHEDKIVLFGSCFSEHIAERLGLHKFQVLKNPFGILYHPAAIANAVHETITEKVYSIEDLTQHNELFHSWNHHSQFSGIDQDLVLDKINIEIKKAHVHLKKAKYLVVTFGSAWAYQLNSNHRLVANCHKYPNTQFQKRLTSVDAIVEQWNNLLISLNQFNSNLNIIFTISPVRHLRDGFRENQWSKSVLHIAVQQLQQQHHQLNYFPAYELIIDDLRDYRFFEQDMVHPNSLAIDYVWERFSSTYFNNTTKELNKQIIQFIRASSHRPFQPKSEAHQKFVKKQIALISQLVQTKKFLDFGFELEKLQSQLVQ
ncbi:GSCFA domain-containing protein [bacterium]|nr:GSCFA domain-containing protein [bacterium]